jgi:hypothetical protein
MSKEKFTSPKGTAQWPWLSKPDTRYDAEGKFKTDLLVSTEEAAPIMETAKKLFVEEFGEKALKNAKWPYMVDDVTGGVKIRAKSGKKPGMFDAKGNVITKDLAVGNGSVIKIAGLLQTYDAGGNKGVTAYLNAVQLIELVEFGGSASFEEEDGYVFTAEETANDNDEPDF